MSLIAGAAAVALADMQEGLFNNPRQLLGVAVALCGAVLMSFGTQYQHRGVGKVEQLSGKNAAKGLSGNQLRRLLSRPSWLVGTVLLGLAIASQLFAMSLAPLIVVQPLGAIALVATTLITARVTGRKPTGQSLMAILGCVGGIFVFVGIAAHFAQDQPVVQTQKTTILVMLALIMMVLLGIWMVLRRRGLIWGLFYVLAAGVLYGFVATLAKVVISSIQARLFDIFTLLCAVALIAAAALGAYFVQTAYSSGPPDLVIAGLTVIDPIVAVMIGMVVLGEAARVPTWGLIVCVIAGVVATWGVVTLALRHPQVVAQKDPGRDN